MVQLPIIFQGAFCSLCSQHGDELHLFAIVSFVKTSKNIANYVYNCIKYGNDNHWMQQFMHLHHFYGENSNQLLQNVLQIFPRMTLMHQKLQIGHPKSRSGSFIFCMVQLMLNVILLAISTVCQKPKNSCVCGQAPAVTSNWQVSFHSITLSDFILSNVMMRLAHSNSGYERWFYRFLHHVIKTLQMIRS